MAGEGSPFTPGLPVTPESFRGKADEVRRLVEASRAAQGGRFERTYVLGPRGMGKSSLCAYARAVADRQLSMLAVHVFLGGVHTLEAFAQRVFEALVRQSVDQAWYQKLRGALQRHVKEVGLFGVVVAFDAPPAELRQLVSAFPSEIKGLLDRLKDDRRGLLLILDDLNGLAGNAEFANWLKSFVDTVAPAHRDLPLHLVVASLPERRAQLLEAQPSLGRVFTVVETGLLSPDDASDFLGTSFARAGLSVDADALRFLVRMAGGHPALLHEIGEAVLRTDSDGRVSTDDALQGVFQAADTVGKKYLQTGVLEAIRSKSYRALLARLSQTGVLFSDESFRRSDLIGGLPAAEARALDQFVRKMKSLGVLESPEEGEYRFVNPLHRLYYAMVLTPPETSPGAALNVGMRILPPKQG